MAKLSSGFNTSALVAKMGQPAIFQSGLMTLATGGAGDLNNGLAVVPFDAYIKYFFVKCVTTSTGTKANAKLSIGHAGDDDAFLNSLALATGVYGNLIATASQFTIIPVATDVWASRKITAGQMLEFNLDALALTATNGLHVGIIVDANG